jgi:signal transduction histidine kinase
MTIEDFNYIEKPFWLRLSIAILLVAAAVILAHGVWLIVDRPINSPLFLAVMILCAWLFGLRVGILTALLSGVAIKYFFVLPYHQFMGDRQDVVRITVFVVEGMLLAWLIHLVRSGSENVRSSREELRALTNRQRTLREDEQKRIALEIHDELGQQLTGLKMDIHYLRNRLSKPENEMSDASVRSSLNDLSEMVDGTIASVRRIASELRPSILDDFGLFAAIEWQLQEFERKTQITGLFRADATEVSWDGEISTSVFRIVQEALTNVARHANATKVQVDLKVTKDNLVVLIRDDGKGIGSAVKHGGLGLLGMRERAHLIGGNLKIEDAQGSGTVVRLTVPKDQRLRRSDLQKALA